MITGYGIEMRDDGVITHMWVGPVADLRGVEAGIEGILSLYFGEGDQECLIPYHGRLVMDRPDSFAFLSEDGKVVKRELHIDNVTRLLGAGLLELDGRESEQRFLHELYDSVQYPVCPAHALSRKGVADRIAQNYKGVLTHLD